MVAQRVRSPDFLPELSALVFDGEEPAGFILCYRQTEPDRLYVGQIGVRRPWRRRGLASALPADALDAAGRAGMTKATLGVDADSPTGAVGVYERVGFTVTNRAVTYAQQIKG